MSIRLFFSIHQYNKLLVFKSSYDRHVEQIMTQHVLKMLKTKPLSYSESNQSQFLKIEIHK